eukprot:4023883-Pleurochrysis_carterae.AAC.1
MHVVAFIRISSRPTLLAVASHSLWRDSLGKACWTDVSILCARHAARRRVQGARDASGEPRAAVARVDAER